MEKKKVDPYLTAYLMLLVERILIALKGLKNHKFRAKTNRNQRFMGVNLEKIKFHPCPLFDPLFEVTGTRKLDSFIRTQKSKLLGKNP